MGAITRAAANNFTTNGIILPAAINNTSVASVTALSQVSAGDGMTLISAQTASATSSVSFTSGIDSTYRVYVFKFIGIHADSGGNDNYFQFNGSTDGGSNYNVTKNMIMWDGYQSENGSSTSGPSYNSSQARLQNTNYFNLHAYRLDAGVSDESLSGYIQIFDPSSTTYVKNIIGTSQNSNGGTFSIESHYSGYFNTTSAINAFRFHLNTGGNFSGKIILYGVA